MEIPAWEESVSHWGRDQTLGRHHGVLWSPPRAGSELWIPAAALAGLGVYPEPSVSLAVPQGPAQWWLQTARVTQSP